MEIFGGENLTEQDVDKKHFLLNFDSKSNEKNLRFLAFFLWIKFTQLFH